MYELMLVDRLPLDQNPAAVYLSGKSASGRITMEKTLANIAEWLVGVPDPFAVNWAALRFQHVNAIKTRMLETHKPGTDEFYSPATVNKYLCAIRGTLKAAYQLDQISLEDYHKSKSVEGVKVENLPAGRALSIGEMKSLLDTCATDPTPAGARDGSLISLLYAAGLRRAEVVALSLDDYNAEDGSMVVSGKGNKQRIAYVLNGCSQAMQDWLEVRGTEPGPLYLPINKSGALQPGRLSTQAIYKMLRKRAAQAKVPPFSPHDLRRTFISDMLDQGNDLSIVADLAGHQNVTTTSRYDRRGETAKKAAADRLFVPYAGRGRHEKT